MMVGGDCAPLSSAFPRISTTVLIPSCPLLARFYAQPTLPIQLVEKKKIKSIIRDSPSPPPPSPLLFSLPPFANNHHRLRSTHAASESWAPAYRLQPCRRGIQRLAAVTERRGKRRVTPLKTIQVSPPQTGPLEAERVGVDCAVCRAEERGDLGVPR